MLQIVRKLEDIPFSDLMAVYEESNRENGACRYPTKDKSLQLIEAEQDFYAYLHAFFQQENSYYALWRQDGGLVSAVRVEPYQDGWLVAGLETRPDARRKGSAKDLLQALLAQMDLLPVYSHIAKSNIPSQNVHLTVGFRKMLTYSVYADGTIDDICETYCYSKTAL